MEVVLSKRGPGQTILERAACGSQAGCQGSGGNGSIMGAGHRGMPPRKNQPAQEGAGMRPEK